MNTKAQRILLKTTIPNVEDDWNVSRFSILKDVLEDAGHVVDARDRSNADGDDSDLVSLDTSSYDQLWLFAVDVVDALSTADAAGIIRFRRRHGGLMTTRDHQDMGSCLRRLGRVGAAHHFQTINPESDGERHVIDDRVTNAISWPNYHSGANGDSQRIHIVALGHPLTLRTNGEPLEYLPAHPHEGVVSVPSDCRDCATLVLCGESEVTNRRFNIAVAFDGEVDDSGRSLGRALAQSTFHHFVDPNLDPGKSMPSFVTESSGRGMKENSQARDDALQYLRNIAHWLGGES